MAGGPGQRAHGVTEVLLAQLVRGRPPLPQDRLRPVAQLRCPRVAPPRHSAHPTRAAPRPQHHSGSGVQANLLRPLTDRFTVRSCCLLHYTGASVQANLLRPLTDRITVRSCCLLHYTGSGVQANLLRPLTDQITVRNCCLLHYTRASVQRNLLRPLTDRFTVHSCLFVYSGR